MADRISIEQRSWNMSQVHSKDTKPELLVRKYLFSKGLRFRVCVKDIPGHPDIVLPKYKAIVEIRGCFWHRHPGCKIATTPKSNIEFWNTKFERNVKRDALHEKQWAELGWRLFVIWECELKPFVGEITLAKLYSAITENKASPNYTIMPLADNEIPMAAENTSEYTP